MVYKEAVEKKIIRYDAIYSRQSVEKEDSLSIQTQIDIARPLCANPIRYYSDPGWSGGTMNRPDLKRMIEDVKKGIINKIVVYRLDRLSRTSMAEFFGFIDFLAKHKVGFVSATEPFDTTTPMGEYMMLTLAGIARLERQNISARISDNVSARVKRGYWVSGRPPFGYDKVKIATGLNQQASSLKANDNIEITAYIMNTYYNDDNASLGTIRDYLNEKNILTATGKRWSAELVKRRLCNLAPVKTDLNLYQYFKGQGHEIVTPPELWTGEQGCLMVKKIDGTVRVSVASWDGYIDSEIYIGCMEKIARKRRQRGKGIGKLSWLLGICRCGYCGYCYTITKYKNKAGEIKRYAYCAKDNNKARKCPKPDQTGKNMDEIEALVEEEIIKIIERTKANSPLVSTKQCEQDPKKQLRLIKIEEELDNFIKILAAGNLNESTMSIINKEVESRVQEKEQILAVMEKERKKQVQIPSFDFRELTYEEKRTVARAYIKEVRVYGNKKLEIVWNV